MNISIRKSYIRLDDDNDESKIISAININNNNKNKRKMIINIMIIVFILIIVILKIVISKENHHNDDEDILLGDHSNIDYVLRDHPIGATNHQYLDGRDWNVYKAEEDVDNINSYLIDYTKLFQGNVPGDLITDMERAGIIEDPLYEFNMKNNTWDNGIYVYTKKFMFMSNSSTILLVFDGIKMGSYIHLNGIRLGETADQFLRYTYDVTNIIQKNNINLLEVIFPNSLSELNNEGRYMACSGGWDWAPYSTTFNQKGSHTFSKGIWKSVYLASIDTVAIEHIVPHIFYEGAYPTQPLTDDVAGPWRVTITVHFFVAIAINGILRVSINGEWLGSSTSQFISLDNGKSAYTTNLIIPVGKIRLWWPQGLGNRLLYTINVEFETYSSNIVISQSRQIGFRLIYLVTGDDSNPSTLLEKDGSDEFTMQINVNGAKIWARGANIIPTDELEGRNSREGYFYLMKAAADGHYNILRIWGGG